MRDLMNVQSWTRRSTGVLVLVLLMLAALTSVVIAQENPLPDSVTVAGTIQSVVGCPGDWQPECEATFLTYDAQNDLWSGAFDLPAGSYEYKAALNGSWSVNYGAGAVAGGANISLEVAEDTTVVFYFDHKTGWITDNVNSIIANVPGSFQSEIGCSEDWMPACLRTWLQDPDGDGIYVYATDAIPAGAYEAKVAVNLSWSVNYGADGAPGGANIPFTVPAEGGLVTFSFDTSTNIMTVAVGEGGSAGEDAVAVPRLPETGLMVPESVTVAGTIQSVLGCPGDWQPECEATFLTYDANDDIWSARFDLPAGSYEYKAALDGSWSVNFGAGARRDGPNIPLELAADTTVEFIFDHKTGWITDSVNSIIANVPGSYQGEIGCVARVHTGDWEPPCLRSWLQDPDGDGIYVFATRAIPAGSYEAKVAVNRSWAVNYGAGGARDGANIPFTVPAGGDVLVTFVWDTGTNVMTIYVEGEGPVIRGNLGLAGAHWLTANTIAWNVAVEDGATYALAYSADGGLDLSLEGVTGGESVTLTYDPAGLSAELRARYPHLARFRVFTIADEDLALIPDILRGQIAVYAVDEDGRGLDATSVQIPGVLDDLYVYEGDLGVTFDDGVPTLRVWAPTARNVTLYLFDDSDPTTASATFGMAFDAETGVWSVTGAADWLYKFYLYEVEVFVPSTGQVENNLVTDPYSISLSMNSTRSQIVDLDDPALMPDGWQELVKPPFSAPEDVVVYELHIRDFSIFDESVPEEYRGTFMAFTLPDSNGMNHLRGLAQAGLTHLHLLPAFDIATINENPAERQEPDYGLMASFPGDSEEQQALIDPIRDQDGFNWGYDPYHYGAPEGSYATNPDGAQRILEFRQMVQALNEFGLRVVMDVVYNHTTASGQSSRSVLDRVVPGYYHRLNPLTGSVERSSCCDNTATEHRMMQRLMLDTLRIWAEAYRVDGFRFDLMGLHTLDNMIEVRDMLDSLTVEANGVNGSEIYVYGEGWNMGEMADNARGVVATQLNIGGTGIGVFNDRLRDAVRGGSPFGGRQEQGFISDLYFNPNGVTPGTEDEQLARLLLFADQIRIGLAGNLRDYTFMDANGNMVTGAQILYNGSPAGYTLDPQENIVYISKHDNETIWDILMYKDLDIAIAEYIRMHNLGQSIVMLSQGVPFFQAGDDLLRSKSLDRNSYNSGDWFNRLDFTYETNNWAVGLPPAGDNRERWPLMRDLLGNEARQVTSEDIQVALAHFREMLAVRRSSPLFRLQTAEQIHEMLVFHNVGPDQIPGLIVMSITDSDQDVDPAHDRVVVLFNAAPDEVAFTESALVGAALELHPVLAASSDPIVSTSTFDAATGTFTVPGRTAVVFVLPQGN